ncbi:MAG: RNA-binding protein [Candidatus Omnitrophota bacterium]|nr:RNA-binding protein [Candidatus Omnitrophota bacterium]
MDSPGRISCPGKGGQMQGNRLYVGNLKYSVTEGQLEELFAQYGTVKDVTVLGNKGFAFIEMAESSEAEKAKDALNGQDFMGRTLRIDEARPRKSREDRGGFNSSY